MSSLGRLVTSCRTRSRTRWRASILRLDLQRQIGHWSMCWPGSPAYQPVDALAISLKTPFRGEKKAVEIDLPAWLL